MRVGAWSELRGWLCSWLLVVDMEVARGGSKPNGWEPWNYFSSGLSKILFILDLILW